MAEMFETDDDLDFWETMGQEPAASEEETPAAEVVQEEAPAEAEADTAEEEAPEAEEKGPARDPETGRFVSKEQAEAIEDPDIQSYLAKYGGDPEKALRAAVEAQRKIGQQGDELGQLRKLIEERLPVEDDDEEDLEDVAAPMYDTDALTEWFEANPHQVPQVALTAYQRGDQALLDAAISAWEDIDRAGARRFERELVKAELRSEQEKQAASRSQASSTWRSVAQEFAQTHPDLNKLAPTMQELAGQYTNVLSVLQGGDRAAQLEVLDFLYTKARDRHSDTLATATKEVNAQQAAEAERAIADAAVASATTAKSEPAKSAADKIGEEWDAYERQYTDGWNI